VDGQLLSMKPRVLMIAYACDPQGGGEHWLGWGWAEQAACNYQVDLITTPRAREAIETRSAELGITPHFVQSRELVRKLSERIGATWWRKLAWQKQVMAFAGKLHGQKKFQLVHQTTFHTFRVPFLAVDLGIPSVWGPIAGGERVPVGFEHYLGPSRYPEAARGLINRLWLNLPAVKHSIERATVIFTSNGVTRNFLPSSTHTKCQIVPPNALRPEDELFTRPASRPIGNGATFKLLYAGNCVATRALPIVFEALQQSALTDYELCIVGAGPAIPVWKQRASELGAKVRFLGKVPYSELLPLYASSDALVFPALRDSGGSALLEAMARFLPVICLDWAGPGEMVDANSGLKIPVSKPAATVSALAQGLLSLAREPERRLVFATAARARAESCFRWQAKREILETTYERLIERQ